MADSDLSSPPPSSSPAPETSSPAAVPSPEPESAAAVSSPEPESASSPSPETDSAVVPSLETDSAAAVPSPDQELASEDFPPAIEAAAVEEPVSSPASDEIAVAGTDNKRKLDDMEKPIVDGEEKQGVVGSEVEEKAPESVAPLANHFDVPAKRQRLDGENDVTAGDEEMRGMEATVVENGQPPVAESEQVTQQGSAPTEEQLAAMAVSTSRKFEIPNNKVGVLIGKAGETIKVLQQNSGAKIQITRDNEADPNSSSRPVELIGTLECINKAEKLIKDVIAEADAGGSPALVARGFGNTQSGSEQHELHVPNEKVGWIIGKGGDTIKNLQTRSGTRIQLIPQHLPEGESPKERLVRITGYKKQIEDAKEMIKEVMNQTPGKHGHSSGAYNQQPFRPRGPSSESQWGSRNPAPAQQATAYDYQQRGTYPPRGTQYPSQPYGSYTQQMPPRSSASAGWEQRAGTPVQTAGYNNYYGQGGQGADNQSIPAATSSQASVNYNYGPSQPIGYAQQTPYAQSAPTQQYYGQQPVNSQPGTYPQQGGTQVDYAQQQPYNNAHSQSYGPPQAATQSSNPMYQGSALYGSGVPTQQPYPYGQTAPTQPAPAYGQAYGPTPGTVDGYTQPPAAAGYPQQGNQVAPGYAQVGQPAPTYAQQGVQAGGYGQYPHQQGYADQSAPNSVNYGYPGGPGEAGYVGSSVPGSGYAAAPASNQAGYGLTGYPQPQTYPTGYEQQSVPPQSGYSGQPNTVPAGYKGVSPQPGYGGQYYST